MNENLDHYQIDPGQLGIEMIEFIILEEIHIVNRNFIKLREMGVKIIDGFELTFDDFILDELEIDYIKINKHFTKPSEYKNRAISSFHRLSKSPKT